MLVSFPPRIPDLKSIVAITQTNKHQSNEKCVNEKTRDCKLFFCKILFNDSNFQRVKTSVSRIVYSVERAYTCSVCYRILNFFEPV